jgi:hypothetical protein
MEIPLHNPNDVELSSELADEMIQPILDCIEIEENDEVAKALIGLFCVIAHEESPDVRDSFVSDLALRIYAKTMACRDAAMAFAA